MNKKYYKFGIGGLLCLLVYAYFQGAFIYPKGALLCSYQQAYSPKYEDGIYVVPFDKGEDVRLFFKSGSSFKHYNDPFIQDGNFFCTALFKIDWKRDYAKEFTTVLFMVKDYKQNTPNQDNAKILVEIPGSIDHPIITSDLKHFYYVKTANGASRLHKFDRKKHETAFACEDAVDLYSKVLLEDGQNIIYTKKEQLKDGDRYITKYSIRRLYADGSTEILLENARYAAWYRKDKSIICSDDKRKTFLYDLHTGKRKELGSNKWRSSPIVSPRERTLLVEEVNPFNIPPFWNAPSGIYYIARLYNTGERRGMREEGNDYDGVPFWLEE